jgi:homopolymeric O-antigen transport system permease protein
MTVAETTAPNPRLKNPPLGSSEEHFIYADGGSISLGLVELWRQRELVWIFTKRQILVRYQQMALGIFWIILEPLAYLTMMTVVFGMLLRVNTGNYPYAVFAFAGIMPWLLFSKATTAAANSLADNMGLISKVYFQRLLLPVAGVVREFFDSVVVFVILVLLAWIFGFPPTAKLLLAPVVLIYTAAAALAVGLWLASIMVPFRDLRPLLGLVLQAGMYATPVLYPPDLVPPALLPYYQLNPIYWTIELFRWLLLDRAVTFTASFGYSVGAVVIALLTGLIVFAKGQKQVVDVQ